jgi:hypothetical protein
VILRRGDVTYGGRLRRAEGGGQAGLARGEKPCRTGTLGLDSGNKERGGADR